eukprot:15328760-Alexandrium_andersonii.AAC.1
MSASLVGSEMCIRDRPETAERVRKHPNMPGAAPKLLGAVSGSGRSRPKPVSYTHLTLPTICSV